MLSLMRSHVLGYFPEKVRALLSLSLICLRHVEEQTIDDLMVFARSRGKQNHQLEK